MHVSHTGIWLLLTLYSLLERVWLGVPQEFVAQLVILCMKNDLQTLRPKVAFLSVESNFSTSFMKDPTN